MQNKTQDIKIVKHWIKHGLKPFVRINPLIKHNHVDNLGAKELLKQFNDNKLSHIRGALTIQNILDSNLSNDDKRDYLLIHCTNLKRIMQ